MTAKKRGIYKRYLQPELDEPVPVSSKYRYMKVSKENVRQI